MRADYKAALAAAGYQDNTIAAQLHRVGKVEQFYGSLDDIVGSGGYEALIADLTYSTADERAAKPNPSRIPFEGNIRNNLQSYKNAAARYVQFLHAEVEAGLGGEPSAKTPAVAAIAADGIEKQRLSLERDMQHALRKNIGLLEAGLIIVDDGMERSVLSGFIDILCRDASGVMVIIELKAGKADARVIGQTLGYMGDLQEEEETAVRGIIVAHDFDQRTRSAAKAVPNLSLFRYAISFQFEPEA
jgi:endonuclease